MRTTAYAMAPMATAPIATAPITSAASAAVIAESARTTTVQECCPVIVAEPPAPLPETAIGVVRAGLLAARRRGILPSTSAKGKDLLETFVDDDDERAEQRIRRNIDDREHRLRLRAVGRSHQLAHDQQRDQQTCDHGARCGRQGLSRRLREGVDDDLGDRGRHRLPAAVGPEPIARVAPTR